MPRIMIPLRYRHHSHNSTMTFNQESPYLIHVIPPHSSARRRTASQAVRIVSSASSAEVHVMPPPIATVTEREKAGPPKSITQIQAHGQFCRPPATRPAWDTEEPITR